MLGRTGKFLVLNILFWRYIEYSAAPTLLISQ